MVQLDEVGEVFEIPCPACGFVHKSDEEVKFYDYTLRNTKTAESIEEGAFAILVDDYIAEAPLYKYCIVCSALKPLDAFDRHSARSASGRQGECRLCKKVYNGIKNQSRISDQHREAAQKRRLYVDITGSSKIDSAVIRARFGGKCFKCGCPLPGPKDGHLDHTLPVSYLWQLTTNNATLLCDKHNGEKSGKWPSEYYDKRELKRLAVRTGIDYGTLVGLPQVNPKALEQLRDKAFVDKMLAKYAPYKDEIIKLRNRLLRQAKFDFFKVTTAISPDTVKQADEVLKLRKD